jgi:hypothetical protein
MVAPGVPSASVSAVPPTLEPTAVPTCPEPNAGTLLLKNDEMGYCFLYSDDLFRVDPYPAEVCLVAEIPALACHSNVVQIEVSDAAGSSAGEVADAVITLAGIDIRHSGTTVAGEAAVVLDGVGAGSSAGRLICPTTGCTGGSFPIRWTLRPSIVSTTSTT